MIKVHIIKQNNSIKDITISGHANYAEKGYDIVCSAVSSIVTTTVNGILKLENTIQVADNQNFLKITVLESSNLTNTLLTNMIELLEDLETQYKKNINIRTEETK